VACLVAHHSGAVFEARERGLGDKMSRYRPPVDVAMLAILNCADLCTAPNGTPVDPDDRIAEVLTRYPADHPVHRAITKSAPLLVAQARLVLGAAEAAGYGQPRVALPDKVEPVEPGPQWRAVWSDDYYRITACGPLAGTAIGKSALVLAHLQRGIAIEMTNRPENWQWDSVEADGFNQDLRAATDAAAGKTLGWTQYRAFSAAADDGKLHHGTEQCALTSWGSTTTLYFDDIVRLHLNMAAKGGSVVVQQRTFKTLGEVTDWTDITHLVVDGPLDLRGLTLIPVPIVVSESHSDA
jgi:hypothetical protein